MCQEGQPSPIEGTDDSSNSKWNYIIRTAILISSTNTYPTTNFRVTRRAGRARKELDFLLQKHVNHTRDQKKNIMELCRNFTDGQNVFTVLFWMQQQWTVSSGTTKPMTRPIGNFSVRMKAGGKSLNNITKHAMGLKKKVTKLQNRRMDINFKYTQH